jgi:hypothetical protein
VTFNKNRTYSGPLVDLPVLYQKTTNSSQDTLYIIEIATIIFCPALDNQLLANGDLFFNISNNLISFNSEHHCVCCHRVLFSSLLIVVSFSQNPNLSPSSIIHPWDSPQKWIRSSSSCCSRPSWPPWPSKQRDA